MAGRPRKPTHLKLVSGTAQRSRLNPAEPQATPGTPLPPAWLSVRATEIFYETVRDLASMGTLAMEWGSLVADYSSTREEIELTTAVLEDGGRVYMTKTASGDTMFRPRPEVGMRAEAMRRAQILRSELGLGPASKGRVSASERREENPFLNL